MFLQSWIQMGGFDLNHHWHGINVLSIFECSLIATAIFLMLALCARFVRRSQRLVTMALIGSLISATAAYAANTALSALSASGALAGANLIYVVQTIGVGGVKATMTQVATFINSLFSGDFTVASGGAATLKNTGPGATGPIGSTTTAPVVTIDAQGRVTALTSATIAGASGATPTATAGPTAIPGSAATFTRSDGAPAIQVGSASQQGILQVDGQSIVATAGVISFNAPINTQIGTSYAIIATDLGKIITLNNASPVAVSIPVASTSGFGSKFYTTIKNLGAGLVTVTPTTSVFDPPLNLTSFTIKQGQSLNIFSDGTNYFLDLGRPTNVACADVSGSTCTIASGTAVLGTSAIASGACASVVTSTATNVVTTDVVHYGYNSDPTAATGYGASATGAVLSVYPYPSAGNVNVKVCNSSSASITPSAMTLNWQVTR